MFTFYGCFRLVTRNYIIKFFFGRIILFLINNRIIANIVGVYMNSKLSIKRIDKTIKENNIDMSLFEKKEWKSFNDFFMRYKKYTCY